MRLKLAAAAALSVMATANVQGADSPIRTNPLPNFIKLAPIETPIMSPSRIEGRLNLSLVVELQDEQTAAALSLDMPHLRNTALTTALEYGRLHMSGYRAVDVEGLRATISQAILRRYPAVQRVLIVKAAALPVV